MSQLLTLTPEELQLRNRIRLLLWLFIIGLVISGITAFPLETEVALLQQWTSGSLPADHPLAAWITKVQQGISGTAADYPFMAYGTDWLAFAHLVIAVAFIGPLRDPVRNIWVLEFGMIACAMVIPLALIAGPVRGIPFFWRIIDCLFGIFGILPLYYCHRLIKRLGHLQLLRV